MTHEQKTNADTDTKSLGDKADEAKGRVKRAAGDLTGDEDLQREGMIDQAASDIKAKVTELADKVKEKVGSGSDQQKR